ncbi:MAG: diguanylate cyclase domain-containing protein [Planctomycetia bacterium]
MAEPDHVTGLASRATLEAFFATSPPEAAPVALVMCDVVGLKAVNEREGFHAGDDCLRRAAERLRTAAADAAILARLGGDELLAVFSGDEALTAAARAALQLAAGFEPTLRAAAILKREGETWGAAVERLYAIVRRS